MTFSTIIAYLKKNYIIAVSATIALICLGVHYVRGEQITRLAADYDDLSVRHTRILKNLKHASEIDGDLEELKRLMEVVDGRLFNPEDLATNQRYFYQIEASSGVKLDSMQQIVKPLPTGKGSQKARKKAARSKFQELVYDMEIRGSYPELLDFMRKVEGGDVFAVLDGFAVVPASGALKEEEAGALSMRVSFSVLGRKI